MSPLSTQTHDLNTVSGEFLRSKSAPLLSNIHHMITGAALFVLLWDIAITLDDEVAYIWP